MKNTKVWVFLLTAAAALILPALLLLAPGVTHSWAYVLGAALVFAAEWKMLCVEEQNLFGSTEVEAVDFDDGTYDPASEEGGEWEPVDEPETVAANAAETAAPTMQSEYAGATPVVIDPIDKPTPTPLPALNFTYVTYEANALHLTFEGPAGWVPDESEADTYRLTNPDPSMDYAATLTVRAIPVNKQYSKSDLTKEVKGMLDTLSASGAFQRF